MLGKAFKRTSQNWALTYQIFYNSYLNSNILSRNGSMQCFWFKGVSLVNGKTTFRKPQMITNGDGEGTK
jgi:uncharacterized protein YodC (DUF2158 family)